MATNGEGEVGPSFPPYVCTLSPEMIMKAETELNEKPEWRSRDVQALRDMVLAQPGTR